MKRLISFLYLSFLVIPFLGINSKADENYFLNDGNNVDHSLIEIIKSSVSGDTVQFNVITTFDRSANDNIRFEDY